MESKMAYKWKTGSRVKADPQAVGEQFEQLALTHEGLTAKSLLEANRPVEAPLHNDYEWIDAVAAEQWRLHQSRHFINSLTVCITSDTDDEPIQTRAVFITTESHKYEPIQAIIKEPDKYAKLLESALTDLDAFRKKYQVLSELESVFKAIDGLEVKTHE